MSIDDGLSDSIKNKIKLASKQANSLSQKFGFRSNISVVCKNDTQGNKKVQYTELCIKSINNTPIPLLRALWIDELISKIQLLINAMDDYEKDSYSSLQSILDHIQNKVNAYPGLAIILIEIETAIQTIEKSFELEEMKSPEYRNQTIH